jgi:TolB-like protein/DNA-binding winged helix-turn-helix (wHTH) protein/Tfp pilus assembly protein PilF
MDRAISTDVLHFEGFRLDRGGLFRRDQAGLSAPVPLGSRALDVLGLLVERQGELISRDAIMEAVWPNTAVEEANLTVQISSLRRVLDHNRAQGSCIQTVTGRGYRFIAPVERADAAALSVDDPAAGNGGNRPAQNGSGQSETAPGLIGQVSATPARRMLHRPWAGIVVAVIGLLLAVAAVAAWSWRSQPPGEARTVPRLSIVVLPFTNISDDRDQQYFADGITEDLTTDLSRIPHMLVISRNTAFTYRNKSIETKQIGRELGVRYVLEGSVRRSGNQLRVTAQLIDADTNAHLWAERFDRDMGDLFTLQNEITSRIANTLRLELLSAEAARPTADPDALDYILRGRAALGKGPSRENHAEVIRMFERALALDPRSVYAQTMLANALTNRARERLTGSRSADIERAEGLVRLALETSPSNPLTHLAKGQLLRTQRRYEEAIPEYEIVLESDRNSEVATFSLGICKVLVGSVDEAIPTLQQSIRLDPRNPFIVYRYDWLGSAYLLQGRTDAAIIWFEKACRVNPGIAGPHAHLAAAYGLKGETERAAAELAEAQTRSGDNSYSSIAHLTAAQFYLGVPKIRALFEATYFAGLRLAGMPEE